MFPMLHGRFRGCFLTDWHLGMDRLMSDYEVNLVNDSMQEFYVRFFGPAESA